MENQNNNTEEKTNQTNTGANSSNIFNDVNDVTDTFSKEDIENGRLMGVLSYIGILVLIPYCTEKSNSYVIYHAKQGLNLLIIEVIASIVVGIVSGIFRGIGEYNDIFIFNLSATLLTSVLSLCTFLLMILGIVNVVNGKAQELPIVGKIKFIK